MLLQMEFMLETICDIKNNKKRPKEETIQLTRIKKWLQKVCIYCYISYLESMLYMRWKKWAGTLDSVKHQLCNAWNLYFCINDNWAFCLLSNTAIPSLVIAWYMWCMKGNSAAIILYVVNISTILFILHRHVNLL